MRKRRSRKKVAKSNKSIITDDHGINKELIKDLKVHTNLAQDIVVTTEDKIRICLMNHLNKIEKKNSWIAPAGILVTIIIALLTTTFKNFYLSADTWVAIFIIGAGLSCVWLISCLRYIFISVKIDDVIEELKKGSPVNKDKSHIIYVDEKSNFIGLPNTSDEIILSPNKEIADETFTILKGTYGITDKNVDVTDKLNALIKDEKLVTEATNLLVDNDPVPGIPKFLDIEYKYQGEKIVKKFKENEAVNLP